LTLSIKRIASAHIKRFRKMALAYRSINVDNDTTRILTTSCQATLFSSQVFEFLLGKLINNIISLWLAVEVYV
jgi:hypothetical protein